MGRFGDSGPSDRLTRQFGLFAGVGVTAAVFHYGALIGLVEAAGWAPVPATLAGYVLGGLVSYTLNRRHVFFSDRPHQEAAWRFASVAGVGFGLTYLFMHMLVERWQWAYLPAQIITTGIVVLWSFLANRLWTFAR